MANPRWQDHPVIVFTLPLIVLLCAPHVYKVFFAGTDLSIDDAKLQRIANVLNSIYALLANSTFISHNTIQRGPHHINKSALTCKPNTSVLRLMELLPYVDVSLVDEPDWIYGSHFMDYRNPDHLGEACDPLHGQSIGWADYMSSSDIALTNWGTGSWNNGRTWVMIYNTERDAIRIFDGENWVERRQAREEFGDWMNYQWFEEVGEYGIWNRANGASDILHAIENNYLTLNWTPWETSNHENGFGVPSEEITRYMQRNGWPNVFDTTQFNVDLIRAKHKPSRKGRAEEAYKLIDSLAGFNHTVEIDGITTYDSQTGQVYLAEQNLLRYRKALEMAVDDAERTLYKWRIQRKTWDLEDLKFDLTSAKTEVLKLCPEGVCVEEQDMILWELLALKYTQEEAQHTNYSKACEYRLNRTPSRDPRWLEKCIANSISQQTMAKPCV